MIMKKPSAIAWFIPMVFLVPVLAYAGYLFWENRIGSLPVYGKTVPGGKEKSHTIPSYELINQNGGIASLESWTNHIVVADFFFTHCPVVCPKMTNNLKKVQAEFSESNVLIRSFSVDPERDSVGQLNTYLKKMKISPDNWELITGEKKTIYNLARNGFMLVATDGDGGPNDFIHSEKLVLVDTDKRIRGYYDGTSDKEVSQLINDIKKLQNEK